MLMVSWFLVIFCLELCFSCGPGPGPHGPRRGRQECTDTFKGRTIRLESLYSKSYWLSYRSEVSVYRVTEGYAQRNEIFDHSAGLSWRLHDCGPGYVCFENMGLQNHWLYAVRAGQDYELWLWPLSDVDRDATYFNKFKIFCDSCEDHRRCQVYIGEYAVYADGDPSYCEHCGSALWFDWDIVLLTPMERWDPVQSSICNKNPTDIGVTFEDTWKVGVSKKVTETHGFTIEFGAAYALKPLPWSYAGKVTQTNQWSVEDFEDIEHTTKVTIRGAKGNDPLVVPPNKKQVLKQLVGYFGEQGNFQTLFKMKSSSFEVYQEDCEDWEYVPTIIVV